MGHMSLRPLQNVLLIAQVIPAIRSDRIWRFVDIGHREGRRMPSGMGEERRRIEVEPADVLCTGMVCLWRVPMIVFGEQRDAVRRQPQIMDGRLTEPLAARMVRVELLVSRRRRALLKGSVLNDRGSRGVVTRVQKLAGFQQHLDDVLVDGVAGRLSGRPMKKEDVHFGKSS